ncbi:hypothetical protein [Burkholderia ubonensis]|uniref:hypothetical protein n=1 Tax=Burkholderia ubonensis TaxID=101571 RepID=UPI000B0AC0EF|nr:hypothetical protein [Burkholderia ubonensis]
MNLRTPACRATTPRRVVQLAASSSAVRASSPSVRAKLDGNDLVNVDLVSSLRVSADFVFAA